MQFLKTVTFLKKVNWWLYIMENKHLKIAKDWLLG